MGTLTPVPLADAERAGVRLATDLGGKSLAELRSMPADELLRAKAAAGVARFPVAIDGYFLVESPVQAFAAGRQAHMPLLVGWNTQEQGHTEVLQRAKPTLDNYAQALARLYGERAGGAMKLYPAATDADVQRAATELASDRFIGYSTWKWSELHGKTSGKPVYRYLYARPRPGSPPGRGAVHSAEIEYALGNLATNKVYAWTADDYRISTFMQSYFANFVKAGDPNGPDVPRWPAANDERESSQGVPVMRLDVEPRVEPEARRDRYRFLDDAQRSRPRATPDAAEPTTRRAE